MPNARPTNPEERRAEIRRVLRQRRASLAGDDVAAASMAVLVRLIELPVLRSATTVAGYRAIRGEIDVDGALRHLADNGAVVTLPRVEGPTMQFVRWTSDTATETGSFGIEEPTTGPTVPFADHEVVLVPLVAFDQRGNRLGQGGGFYDRAIAQAARRPILIGVAHAFQEVREVPIEAWDQALDAVVTEDTVHEFRPGVLGREPS